MEKTLLEGDIKGLLAGLIVLLALSLFWSMAKFLFGLLKKKSDVSDQAIAGIVKIENRMMAVERDLNEILKFRQDFNKLFEAVKELAGPEWPRIKKKIRESRLD